MYLHHFIFSQKTSLFDDFISIFLHTFFELSNDNNFMIENRRYSKNGEPKFCGLFYFKLVNKTENKQCFQ